MKIRKRNEKGTALVEMAIVLPIFILILIGTVEFGIVLHDYLILQNASREGARFGAVGNSEAAVKQRVQDFAMQLNNADLVVEVTNAQGVRGSTLVVKASYPVPFTPIMELLALDDFGLEAESLMRLE